MLPQNMKDTWVFANFAHHLVNTHPEVRGVITDYAERLDPEFNKGLGGPTLIDLIWGSLQSYLDKPRETGWHRRVIGGWPNSKAGAMIMAAEMRVDAVTLWNMGASRESSELIRAAEAARQLSYLTLCFADGSAAGMEEAIKQLCITCPNLDYEFGRAFPRWNDRAAVVELQQARQTAVFTNPKAPLKDDD